MAAEELTVASWTAQERESFFDAIARHRRAAGRIGFVSGCCAFILALVVAMLMSPLLYALIGLVLDVVNFVVPTPDIFKRVMDSIGPLVDNPEKIALGHWFYIALLAAIPGLVAMSLIVLALGRVLREAAMSDAGNFTVRAPDPTVLAQQRFANVVAEMAVAAGLPSPRVFIIQSAAANAAAFGQDARHATVAVSTGLLESFDRAQMQGIAGHLVGSIANGDMAAGTRVATTLSLFGLIAKLSESFGDREAAKRFVKLVRGAARRGSSVEDGELALELTNPFGTSSQPAPPAVPEEEGKIPWRTLAWMPLVGPLVISGFFGGMLSTFALSPLLAWVWRRRKFLADATAVRLTREPNTLSKALVSLNDMPWEGAFAPWTAHMSVVNVQKIGGRSLFSSSGARMFPSLERRLKALTGMGAEASTIKSPRTWQNIPAIGWAILVPVGALVLFLFSIVIVLLAYVSVALSGLFTWLPAILIHAILR
ncbi:MAG TPA: M48 family metalloprotease [Steroidobacteraceae bacterium]|jgi:Zn-dependent protease with chaperone function